MLGLDPSIHADAGSLLRCPSWFFKHLDTLSATARILPKPAEHFYTVRSQNAGRHKNEPYKKPTNTQQVRSRKELLGFKVIVVSI